MIYLLALAILAHLGLLFGTILALTSLGQGIDALVIKGSHPRDEELWGKVNQLDAIVDGLPIKWEEMVNRSKRHEDRARQVVSRARKELAESGFEHPGIEAEVSELRRLDGSGGEEGGVPTVPASVGGDPRQIEIPTDEGESEVNWEVLAFLHRNGVR